MEWGTWMILVMYPVKLLIFNTNHCIDSLGLETCTEHILACKMISVWFCFCKSIHRTCMELEIKALYQNVFLEDKINQYYINFFIRICFQNVKFLQFPDFFLSWIKHIDTLNGDSDSSLWKSPRFYRVFEVFVDQV